MKKVLALLLALVLVVGMFAGCKKEPEKVEDDTQDPTISENVENNEEQEENQETEPDDENKPSDQENDSEQENSEAEDANLEIIDGRQEMWESVFAEGKFTVDATSFVMKTGDTMTMTLLTDAEGKSFVEVFGAVEGEEIGVALYQPSDTEAFFHNYGKMDGEELDVWYKCTGVEESSSDDNTVGFEVGDTTEFTNTLKNIQKVEYVGSNGNIDRVLIHYVDTTSENIGNWQAPDGATVLDEILFEVEYDGETSRHRYIKYETEDGVALSSVQTEVESEKFTLFDWEFDRETMKMVNKEDETLTVECKEIVEDVEVPDDAPLSIITVELNSETYAITKMSLNDKDSGVLMSIELTKCENVADHVGAFEATEEIAMQDAVMQLGMTMFALVLSGVEDVSETLAPSSGMLSAG